MGDAAERLRRTSDSLRRLPDEAVRDGLRTISKAARAAMVEDTGGDRQLSGVRNGTPLRVRTVRRRTGTIVEGRVMAGPPSQRALWFWLEEGTRAGRRGAGVGRFEGVTSRRTFRGQHPGTPPKRTWTRSVVPAVELVRQDFERRWRDAVRNGR